MKSPSDIKNLRNVGADGAFTSKQQQRGGCGGGGVSSSSSGVQQQSHVAVAAVAAASAASSSGLNPHDLAYNPTPIQRPQGTTPSEFDV